VLVKKNLRNALALFGALAVFATPGLASAQANLLPDRIETSGGVLFEAGGAQLRQESFIVLNEVARLMRDRRDLRIEVQVHSDSRGSDVFNYRMSQERAAAILAYLVQAGVPRDHLTAQGFGETCPIASNQTAAGRAQNSRVVFWRTDSGLPRSCPIPPPPPPSPEPDDQSYDVYDQQQ
jgi:outer membrane protein OmpA-like peptidoglycan-associated protein